MICLNMLMFNFPVGVCRKCRPRLHRDQPFTSTNGSPLRAPATA